MKLFKQRLEEKITLRWSRADEATAALHLNSNRRRASRGETSRTKKCQPAPLPDLLFGEHLALLSGGPSPKIRLKE